MDSTSSIAAMRQSLAAFGPEMAAVDLILLFGSVVSGRARPTSDLDVAVLGREVVDLDSVFLALAPKLKTPRLDLVDLRRAGPILAFEAARSGVVLFERTRAVFRQFQSLASRRYADTRKLREAQRRSLQVFLAREF
jgi:predicted nucleotidyltransferase